MKESLDYASYMQDDIVPRLSETLPSMAEELQQELESFLSPKR